MKKLLILFFCFGLFNFGSLALFGANPFMNEASATYADKSNSQFGTASLSDTLCRVLKFVTGSVGKTIATFAIIFIGVTFLNGKCNWTVLVTFSVGLAAIFAAPKIIETFTGGANGAGICSAGTGGTTTPTTPGTGGGSGSNK